MPSTARNQIIIGNSLAEIAKVADFVDQYGAEHSVPPRAINNLNLCLDELLNNTISYGYADDASHEIVVDLSLEGPRLVAEIRDDAAAFDPSGADTQPVEGKIGGLGLHFVKSLMDEISYVREGKFNVVKITKKLEADL